MKALLLCAVLLLLPANARALPKYGDWSRIPATGHAVPSTVSVYDGNGIPAHLFKNADGTTDLPNPFSSGPDGYFEFYAAQGEYEVRIVVSSTELYRLHHVSLADPTGPQTILSSPTEPALTTAQVAEDGHQNRNLSTTAMELERCDPGTGALLDGPWLVNGFRAEQGIEWDYNTYDRYCDRPEEVQGLGRGFGLGSNEGDPGDFRFGSIRADWFGGGIIAAGPVELSAAAGSSIDVDMAVDGAVPAPGDVVVLSTAVSNAVKLTSTPGARSPLVVVSGGGGRALLAVSGIATAHVVGPVHIGDVLVTSSTTGYAQAGHGVPAPETLGSAVSALVSGTGTVQVRIGLVDAP